MKTKLLLKTLTSNVESMISEALRLNAFGEASLNIKKSEKSWSALQCIEHLNRYANYYLPKIETAINNSSGDFIDEEVKYSFIGEYSVKMMHPENRKKQKTFRHMDTAESEVSIEVIDQFLAHQQRLLVLLDKASAININKGKVPVEFFRLLKMKIGETLQFVVVHQQRHMLQVEEALQATNNQSTPVLAL